MRQAFNFTCRKRKIGKQCREQEINTKDKLIVRQVIGHLNFSYDHVFILQNKIIANDKIKQVPVVYDLK